MLFPTHHTLQLINVTVCKLCCALGVLVSSALLSLGHGGNDAQKVMGLIAATLMVYFKGVDPASIPDWAHITLVGGKIHAIPHWIVLGCYLAISVGTISGGWKIVKTMGTKITKLTSFEAIAADSASIIGASGYSGAELTRLLLQHPNIELQEIVKSLLSV